MSGVTDFTKKSDLNTKFLDVNKPLVAQVWNGGFTKDFYLEQVHRPRYYLRGDSAPFFGNFLEPLTKTAWFVPPIIWLPSILFCTFVASQGLGSTIETAGYVILGLGLWPLVEYGVHRGVFHMDKNLPDNRVCITLHFLLHGHHHFLPADEYRAVTPPALLVAFATLMNRLVHFVFYWNEFSAMAVFSGLGFGYIRYEVTHYFLHHRTLSASYMPLKKHHLRHHYADHENGFGVTTRFWDKVFGTDFESPRAAKVA